MENKKRGIKTPVKVIIAVVLIVLIIIAGFYIFNYIQKENSKNLPGTVIINPMQQIVIGNTKDGVVDESAVVSEGIIKFNESYINYLLAALGAGKLHSSPIYGSSKIEMILDSEVWSSEFSDYLVTKRGSSEIPDLRIKMSKEVAVRALLSSDIKQFMKDSVVSGKIQIDAVAGNVELFSKGYLDMYKEFE